MIALIMISVIAIYFYIAFKVCKYVYKKQKKYVFLPIIFFLLLPTWDVIVGKIYFNHLCKTEGGIKIYKHIKSDSFLDTSKTLHFFKNKINKSDIKDAKRFLDYGFRFYEVYGENNGKKTIVHFEKNSKGDVVYKILDKPVSMYRYEYKHRKINSKILGIYSFIQLIKNKKNKIAVKQTTLHRCGWISKLIDKYIGGVKCELCFDYSSSTFQDDFKYRILKGDFDE